jgi:rRNA maturation endonuclease Nob1
MENPSKYYLVCDQCHKVVNEDYMNIDMRPGKSGICDVCGCEKEAQKAAFLATETNVYAPVAVAGN